MLVFRRNPITRANLSKFRHARFNYARFVRNYYMVGDEAYIVAKVESFDDIISKYSEPGYEWLNEDFTTFVDNCAYHIPVEESIVLEIVGTHFTADEKVRIARAIVNHYGLELGEVVIEMKLNAQRARILLILAIMTALVFYLLFQFTDSVFVELIVVGMWFFVWELGSVGWLERSDLRLKKLEAGQLASMRVQFVETAHEHGAEQYLA